MISPQASSLVEAPVSLTRVWLTGIPRSPQAFASRLGARAPVSVTSLSLGRRSTRLRGNGVRSRIRHTISNGASRAAASSSEAKASWNTVISTPRRRSRSQSADFRARCW